MSLPPELWLIVHEYAYEDTDMKPFMRAELDKLPDTPEYAEVRAAVEALLNYRPTNAGAP